VIDDVWTYARETQNDFDHVLRWIRVLKTFGALQDMTAAEAQGYSDQHLAARWDPMVEELRNLENAQGDYEPDQQVIDDVWDYAQETQNGFDHVHRWMRALKTFGALQDMTAAEAQGYAEQHVAERWDPVVAELERKEAAASTPQPTPEPTPQPTPSPQEGYEPDPEVIDDVWTYAGETDNGYDHVLRWIRVLKTLGAVEDMSAAEAQDYADQHLAARWDPVAAELAELENAPGDYEPDQQVIADVESYAGETGSGFDHVHRWMRVLKTLGAVEDMTAAEAQEYADQHVAERWDPVVVELRNLEAATSGSEPTPAPTAEPTPEPTPEPTAEPTPEPTPEPTATRTPEDLARNGYKGQLADVVREMSLRRPGGGSSQQGARQAADLRSMSQTTARGNVPPVGAMPQQDPTPDPTPSTSIVYVIDDSGSMDGDFPEVRTALEEVRDTDMPNTKVALIVFGGEWTKVFGLTAHSTDTANGPWTDARINAFGGKMGQTHYRGPLSAAAQMLRWDSAQVKKIIFLTDAQHSVSEHNLNEMKDYGIVMDSVALGNHYEDNFDALESASSSTGGEYRMVVKPLQGTTNDPAVETRTLSEILPESVVDNTATMFLVDYSGSMYRYDHEHGELKPALAVAVAASKSATNAKVGLAAFRSPDLPGFLPRTYRVYRLIGSQSLSWPVTKSLMGSTDIGWGLRKAHATVSAASATNKRVVLVSDGITAVDMPATTLAMFGTGAGDVRLDIVAWGPHADRVLMKSWADTVGGNFNVVTPIEEESEE